MDGIWNTVGDNDIWGRYENRASKRAAKMDGVIIPDYGMDADLYIAGDAAQYIGTWNVVYFGGWIVIFIGGDILPVAEDAFFTRGMASVCNWRNGMLLFRGTVRMHY